MPEFSLVCSTKGRRQELVAMLESLQGQTFQDFEIIVVDQNDDGFLDALLAPFYGHLALTHLHSAGTGVSAGRNEGIACCSGLILGFPDDDCEYPVDLLDRVRQNFLLDEGLGVFCGSCRLKMNEGLSASRFVAGKGRLTMKNFWRRHIAFVMFIKKEALQQVGFFDERLGVGRWFGSAEETDLLLRLLVAGVPGRYEADVFAYHPAVGTDSSMRSLRRAWSYGLGWGGFIQKQLRAGNGNIVLPAFLKSLYRSLGGCILMFACLRWGRAGYYACSFAGRCCGFFTPLF